jgi:DNA repair exonuclease SbcCD ATPase subunit
MENGKKFRSSMFGGFNKQDVMSYIEQLTNELSEVKKQFAELEEQFNAQSEKLEEIPVLEQQLEEKSKVEEENEKLLSEVEQLRSSQRAAQDEYEKVKAAEAQLGAAFVDARRYSDEIVSAAKDRAADVSKQASDDISLKAEQIRQVASDAEKLTAEMRSKMEALSRSISDLSGKMSAVAVTLVKTEAPTAFKPRVDFDALKEMGFDKTDDITAVEKDEETGLTFISYEPNTHFNNDLDFKPEAAES